MTGTWTAEWIEQQRRRLADVAIDLAVSLVIEQHVTADPPLTWHVVVADGSARIDPGPHPAPDVTLTVDDETATAIAAGTASAQRAFLDGRLRIGGDVQALMTARDTLARILT